MNWKKLRYTEQKELTYPRKVYHIFTNNMDEYTRDKAEAYRIFEEWATEYGCARLYESIDYGPEEGYVDDGDCIESAGEFPI